MLAPFWFSLCAQLVLSQIFGPLPYFLPCLIVAVYTLPQEKALWFGLGCGGICDLLSAPMPFGLCALLYTTAVYLLLFLQRRFFVDEWTTLPLLTLLVSPLFFLVHPSLVIFLAPVYALAYLPFMTPSSRRKKRRRALLLSFRRARTRTS